MTTFELNDYVSIITVECKHRDAIKNHSEFHRIGVRHDGRLVFFDHFGIMGTEIQLYQAANPNRYPHTCSSLLKQWTENDGMNGALRQARGVLDEIHKNKISKRAKYRCKNHRHGWQGTNKGKPQIFDAHGRGYKNDAYATACVDCAKDKLLRPARERFERYTLIAAKSAIEAETRFKRAEAGHKVIVTADRSHCPNPKCRALLNEARLDIDNNGDRIGGCCGLPAQRGPWVVGKSEREWDRSNERYERCSEVHINVTPHWYIRVYRRGLAVVDGYFVLDASPIDSRGRHLLLVAHPSRGYSVTTRRAWYRPSDGKVRWI